MDAPREDKVFRANLPEERKSTPFASGDLKRLN
jgi:hypothetical protein